MAHRTMNPDIHRAVACITKAVDQSDAYDVYLETCRSLPSSLSISELVKALPLRTREQLERRGMQQFCQQLQQRRQAGRVTDRIPRPLTELRSAAKAWDISPLVLLAEFVDAPLSDHFWRRISLLARRGRSQSDADWMTVRKSLYAARDRRQYGILARRKGVSRSLTWTLMDIESVLQEGGEKEEKSGDDDDNDEDTATTQKFSQSLANEKFQNRIVWPLSIGWWISRDLLQRICVQLAPLAPDFSVVDQSSATVLASATTLLVPVQTRTPQLHWALGVVERTSAAGPETTMTLHDPLSSGTDPRPSLEAMSVVASLATCLWSDTHPPSLISSGNMDSSQHYTGMDSGIVVLVGVLNCLFGCPLPPSLLLSDIDSWLWRRCFVNYAAYFLQNNDETEVATVMAADHITMLSKDSPEQLASLRTGVAEARVIWDAAALKITLAEAETAVSRALRAVREDLEHLTVWLAVNSIKSHIG